MRRLVSYVAVCAALLIGTAASVAPTINNANADMAYATGKTLNFRVSNDQAYYSDHPYNPDYFLSELDANASEKVEYIADTMRERLDLWGLSEYVVETSGYDTVSVTLRSSTNTSTMYGYLKNYLAFSGGNFEFDVTDKSLENPSIEYKESWNNLLDLGKAEINYVDTGSYKVPTVICPLYKDTVSDFKSYASSSDSTIIDYCSSHYTPASTDEEGNETPASGPSVLLWANRHDLDALNNSIDGTGTLEDTYAHAGDPNVASRIFITQTAEKSFWYDPADNTKDEEKAPYFMIIPNSGAVVDDKTFDNAKAQEAYEAAVYYRNMLNASELKYHDDKLFVSFMSEETVPPTVEALTSTDMTKTVNWNSGTIIATIAAFLVSAALLIFFDRMLGLLTVAISSGVTFGAYYMFVAFAAQFNVAAFLGLAAVYLLSVFSGTYFNHKLKDELYKGRTLKKAHAEASKKSVMPVVDASVISVILGTFIYVFAGDLASKLGTLLFIGGFLNLLGNTLVSRLISMMLCNDNTAASKFGKLFNLNEEKIPNLLEEEKQTYFGPYEGKNFNKGNKVVAAITGVLTVAGIATMLVFGLSNNGNVYNNNANPTTSIYVEHRYEKSDMTGSQFNINSISDLNDPDDGALSKVYLVKDGENVSFADLTESVYFSFDSTKSNNNAFIDRDSTPDNEHTYYWFYFRIEMKDYYDLSNDYKFAYKNGDTYVSSFSGGNGESYDWNNTTFEEVVYQAIEIWGDTSRNTGALHVSAKTVTPSTSVPYLWRVCLACGVSIAVSALYLAIRFRPSRGVSASLLALFGGFVTISFFVFTRIPAEPIVALGAACSVLLSFLYSLYILNNAKDIAKDSREKDKSGIEFRTACLTSANSRGAAPAIFLGLCALLLTVIGFGLGPTAYAITWGCFALGAIITLVLSLNLLAPSSFFYDGLFSKIKLPERKKKKKVVDTRRKSAEPEEAIFIGVND